DSGRRARAREVPKFLPQHRRVDAQLLRDLVSELIAHNPARDALNVRQEEVHRLYLALCTSHRELGAGPLDQIIKVALGMAYSLGIGVSSFAANEQVGIKTRLQPHHLDIEILFPEQAHCSFGRMGARGIRIEIYDDVLAEPA